MFSMEIFILLLRYITSITIWYIVLKLEWNYQLIWIMIIQILIFLIFYTRRENNENLSDLKEWDWIDVFLELIPFIDAFLLIILSIYLLII